MKKCKISLSVALMASFSILLASCSKEKENRSMQSDGAETNAEMQADKATSLDEVDDDVKTVVGVAVGGAHSSIELHGTDGKDYEFAYPDLAQEKRDTWVEGDTMVVEYIPTEGDDLDSVVSLKQKNPGKDISY